MNVFTLLTNWCSRDSKPVLTREEVGVASDFTSRSSRLDLHLSRLCLASLICLCMLTVGVGNVWGLVASEVADSKATSITDGGLYIIATAKNSGKYLTTNISGGWGVCTTTLGDATIFTAHGSASGFYLTCPLGTLIPNTGANFLAYNTGSSANLTLNTTTGAITSGSTSYILRYNSSSSGGGRWYTSNTGDVMYLFKLTPAKRTITYNAGTGSCKSSDTESSAGGGIVLASATPSASCSSAGWTFVGWKRSSAQTETTTIPSTIAGGSTYYPNADETLYAVYRLGDVYTIDFESAANSYTNWTISSITSQGTSANALPHGGSKIGLTSNTNGSYSSVKTTSAIPAPKSIRFYISKTTTNTTGSSWTVYTSSDGSTWDSRSTTDAKAMDRGVWQEVITDLSNYSNVYVKVEYGTSNAQRAIDDVLLSCATYNSNPSCCTELGSINRSVS